MTKKVMTEKRIYPGVNCFKLAAALFVIMIHTSPLTSFSAEADFVLTRILARTAVPFFFMVTGFFVLPKALGDTAQGLHYLRRIGLIYLASVLLYFPVNLYAGHFRGVGAGGFLRMLLIDGTFYHLWYLPALLLGFALVWAGLKALPWKAVLGISVFLYLLGLPDNDDYYSSENNRLGLTHGELLERLKDKDPSYYYTDILVKNGMTLQDFIGRR